MRCGWLGRLGREVGGGKKVECHGVVGVTLVFVCVFRGNFFGGYCGEGRGSNVGGRLLVWTRATWGGKLGQAVLHPFSGCRRRV